MAGYVGAVRAEKKTYRCCDVAGLASAPQCGFPNHGLPSLLGEVRGHVRFDETGSHDVGPPPVREQALIPNQCIESTGYKKDDNLYGSWDPIGPWGEGEGGRVYSTATGALILEVYYRYARVAGAR